MPRLAFLTIGILHEPMGHPRVQGFVDRIPGVFDSAEASAGFLDRSRLDMETGEHSWGDVVRPEWFQGTDPMRAPATLSLWEDLESVAAFAYRGAHGEAMTRRKEWFMEYEEPKSCGWWVEDGHVPDWSEAAERFESLLRSGPTAFAFNIRSPFDADGRPAPLDPEKVRSRSAANEAKSG